MNKLIYITLLSVLLFASSCNNEDIDSRRWRGKEYSLVSETVHPDSDILANNKITLAGDYLIIERPSGEKEYSVFQIKDDSLIYKDAFLTIGRGPFEVNGGNIYYIPEENSIVIVGYNFFGKNMVVPLDTISNLFSYDLWREYNNSTTSSAREIIPIDTISYIVSNASDDNNKMFSVLNAKQSTLSNLNIEYPDNINAPFREKAITAYGGRVLKRPWYNQFAYSTSNGHYVKVFTYDEKMQIVKETAIFDEIPEYTVNGNKVKRAESCKAGLIMNVTENYIYLGEPNLENKDFRSAMEKNGYPAGYAKTIYVSDWEGNPVIKYITDRAVVFCAIDKSDEYLYAFAFNEETLEPDIVRFKLPDLKTDSK